MKSFRTREELERDEAQWFTDHPEYTRCVQCQTVIKKALTRDGRCPDCSRFKKILG